MKRTTILFVIDKLSQIGGTEKHLYEVVKRLDREKYKPVVCCFEAGPASEAIKEMGVTVYHLPIGRIYGLTALRLAPKLRRLIIEEKPRIIQTFHFKSNTYALLIGRLSNVRVLISSRRDLGMGMNARLMFIQRIINTFTDKIIVPSEAVKRWVTDSEKLNGRKVITIHNGVDLEQFNQEIDVSRERERLGLAVSDQIVGSLANVHPIKGYEYFVQAASLVLKKMSGVKFLIIGNTSNNHYYERIRNMIENSGISQSVLFTGYQRSIYRVLAVMDVSVLCSLSEGFSNSILESMAMGKPVVVSNVGGNPEAVIDGETGYLVEPCEPVQTAHCILRILRDRNLAKRMGSAGRKRVENQFCMEKMLRDLENLYDSVV